MAHYAKVSNGIVTKVIVAEADFFNNFVDDSPGQWLQTSYNTRGGKHYDPTTGLESTGKQPLRKNYAGIGFTYDTAKDAFIPAKPFNSWILNEETCLWDSPVPYPSDDKMYSWDEDALNWVELVME
jgi:hypothetical protein